MNTPTPPHDSAYADAMSALQPGWLVGNGRYTLIQQLGAGGMGAVWLAEDEQLRERVALKFLSAEIGLDPVALEDLKRETARARKLTHPNIVRIHDFFKAEHEAFISMEYVEGAHLGNLRRDQLDEVFAWKDLQPLLIQLCAALDHAHTEGVVHRDIKPANLMVDRKGRLKLADFGISDCVAALPGDLPARHTRSGTIVYMSPGQLDGNAPGVADDIYAVGSTVYELLTGQPPFCTGDIAHQIRSSLPPPMNELLAQRGIQRPIPAPVNALIMACLAKEPSKRPQSARAIMDWLNAEPPSADAVARQSPVVPVGEQSEHLAPKSEDSPAGPTPADASAPAAPILPPVKNWPETESKPISQPTHRRLGAGVVAGIIVGLVALAAAALLAWRFLGSGLEVEAVADGDGAMDADVAVAEPSGADAPSRSMIAPPIQSNAPVNASATTPPTVKPTTATQLPAKPPTVRQETGELVVWGDGFVVEGFGERGRAFSNRKYIWQQVPGKFNGWSYTQTSGGHKAQIRVLAKRDTVLFAAIAASPPGLTLPGWEPDGTSFIYTDGNRTRMVVHRKRVGAGQQIDIPQSGWAGAILLFAK